MSEATTAAPDASLTRPAWHAGLAVAATVVAIVPALVALVVLGGREWVPLPDTAALAVRVRDVLGGDLPLVGAYSRYGWNHPGPLLLYALAPITALSGGAAWGTLIGAPVLQAVAVALSCRLAWRRGGLTLVVLVATAVTLTTVALTRGIVLDPWNPNPPVAFLALFVLQVWAAGLGDRWQIVGAAVVGTFLVQAHIGYAPLVALGAIWLLVCVVVRARRVPGSFRALRTPIAVGAGIAAVLWLPAIVEQLTADPGNITRLVRFAERGNQRAGVRWGVETFAAEFEPLPPWAGGAVQRDATNPIAGGLPPTSSAWLVVPVGALIAAAVLATRRARRDAARLVELVALMVVVGIGAIAVTALPLFEYLYQWKTMLATLVAASVAWAVLVSLRGAVRRWCELVACIVVGVALVWGSVSVAVDVARNPVLNIFEGPTDALLEQARDSGLPGHPVLVLPGGDEFPSILYGVIDALDRDGVDVRVDREFRAQFGDDRVAAAADVAEVWFVAEEGSAVRELLEHPGARVVARTTPLPAAHEQELFALQRALADRLRAGGNQALLPALETSADAERLRGTAGIGDGELDRLTGLLERLEAGGGGSAIIAFDADDAPSTRQRGHA